MGLRGHKEEEGNLWQLLKCCAEDDPVLKEWFSHSSYKSHDIINELIQLMANQQLKKLFQDVHEAEWFALIADETRDVSGSEQLGVSLRWVDKNYGINEDMVGLVEVEMTDAATLTSPSKTSYYDVTSNYLSVVDKHTTVHLTWPVTCLEYQRESPTKSQRLCTCIALRIP